MPGQCCPGKPVAKMLTIGGQQVGIAGFDSIMAKGLEHANGSDEDQRRAILEELKANNYVPESVEAEYLQAVWDEFRQVRGKHLGQIEEKYQGVPREEIHWFPSVDDNKCTACGKCAKFCKRGVYTFDTKPHITNPYRCVVSCTGCQKTCPDGAITFPTLVSLRDELKALRKKHGILG